MSDHDWDVTAKLLNVACCSSFIFCNLIVVDWMRPPAPEKKSVRLEFHPVLEGKLSWFVVTQRGVRAGK